MLKSLKGGGGTIGGRNRGFTLIEILVVVAIIAILSSVVLIGLGPTRRLGRDARRISDLRQLQNGLEVYFNRCGSYPGGPGSAACPALAGDITGVQAALQTVGVTQMPTDPTAGATYGYGVGPGGTGYTISADLEDPTNPAAQGQAPSNGQPCGQAAGNGGITYCVSL